MVQIPLYHVAALFSKGNIKFLFAHNVLAKHCACPKHNYLQNNQLRKKPRLTRIELLLLLLSRFSQCPSLCDPIDGSPPGFPVPGIRQARTLEWVAIPLMRKRRNHKEMARRSKLACACCPLNCVGLVVIPWTAGRQAPLSMGFSRQEYESGLPFPPSGELPDPGIQPASSA